MAQDRAGATRKDSTEEPTLGPQLAVAERVDAAPEPLEPPRLNAALDRARSEPAGLELAEVTTPNWPAATAAIARSASAPRVSSAYEMKVAAPGRVAGLVLRVGALCYGSLGSAAGRVRAAAAFQGADLGGWLSARFVGHQLLELG